MCPSCLSGGIGPGYIAAFIICVLFFLTAGLAMLWASRSGQLEGLEDTKYQMLKDD
ncbi:MAG: cbb3-type cytochrome oxidase assembly protein [Candidatus Melainabacteria bacterium]